VTFLDQQHALGTISKQIEQYTGGMLATLTLTTCTRQVIGPVDPTDPRIRTGGRISLSSDKNFLAYPLYVSSQAIVWNIKKQQVERRIDISPLFIGEEVTYTPDGRLLLIAARTRPFAGDDSKTCLLFYDARTYQQLRRLEIPGVSAIAISPDSRLLAVGYTEENKKAFSTTEQAKIVIYDIATGKEVARALHPPVKQQRSDPFIAKVTRLAFTPDGEYLLSSTYDTRLWQFGL
jgi:WD40 repeat protein